MKCQICKKNESNIVFTQIINNEKVVLQICSECAQKKGISIEIESPTPPKIASFIGGFTAVSTENVDADIPDLTCPNCGLTFAEFKHEGLFGCDQCHTAFGEHVSSLLKQIHGTDVYEGNVPEKLSVEGKAMRQLKKLRDDLRHSIDAEDYEKAAELRDRISELEGKMTGP